MNTDSRKTAVLAAVLLAGVVPALAGLLVSVPFGATPHVQEPLHEMLELLGAFIGLGVVLLLTLRASYEAMPSHLLWVRAALVVMCLLGAAHGLVPWNVVPEWEWLGHGAIFLGGCAFGLMWVALPIPVVARDGRKLLGASLALAVGSAAVIVLRPDFLPATRVGTDTSLAVTAANMLGGVGFFGAAILFFGRYLRHPTAEDLVFASFTLLFGTSSALFGFADPWSAGWWAWHVFRAAAFAVLIATCVHRIRGLYGRQALGAAEFEAAREALTASEERLRSHVERTPIAVLEYDRECRITSWNPAAERIFGYTASEALGRHHDLIIPASARGAVRDIVGEVMEHDTAKENVNENLTKDGRTITCSWYNSPLTTPGGALWGMAAFAVDVTEQKRAEAALRNEHAFSERLLNALADTVFVFDPGTGRAMRWNDAFRAVSGYSDEEISSLKAPEAYYEGADLARAREALRALRAGGTVTLELTFRAKDGRATPYEYIASAMQDQDGGLEYVISVGRDITEHKRAEAELRRSREALLHAQRVANVGSWTFDPRSQAFQWSDQVFHLFGLDAASEPPGWTEQLGLIHPEDRGHYEKALRQALRTHVPAEFEVRAHPLDGTVRHHLIRCGTVAGEDGLLLMGTTQDITDHKRAEESQRTVQKLESLGTLAGGIAHDFNNLLTGITGNLSLLRADLPPDPEMGDMLREAEAACQTAKGLAHQLLTFASGGDPVVRSVDLVRLVQEAARFATRGSTIRCVFGPTPEPVHAEVDRDQISQVVQNLVLNAVQAMPLGGTIDVDLSRVELSDTAVPSLDAGSYACLRIRDQGIGIPSDVLPRVFDPYFTTKSKGRGLGLAVCYSVVARHGGSIQVESEPNAGTTFTVYLRASQFPTATEAAAPQAAPSFSGSRFLIMDDEGAVAKVLQRMLARLGAEAEIVLDGAAALEAYARARDAGTPFSVVVADLTIPGGMGGKEMVARLHEIHPSAKVVVSSGYSNDPVLANHQAMGFCGVLAKPYGLNNVKEALGEALKGPHQMFPS